MYYDLLVLMTESEAPVSFIDTDTQDTLFVETEDEARTAVLLADALEMLSAEVHLPNEVVIGSNPITRAVAEEIVRHYGNCSKAAKVLEINPQRIQRALRRKKC